MGCSHSAAPWERRNFLDEDSLLLRSQQPEGIQLQGYRRGENGVQDTRAATKGASEEEPQDPSGSFLL